MLLTWCLLLNYFKYYTGKRDDKLNVLKHGITAKKSCNKTQQPLQPLFFSSETYFKKTRLLRIKK